MLLADPIALRCCTNSTMPGTNGNTNYSIDYGTSMELEVRSPAEMVALGRSWSSRVRRDTCIYFEGGLGTGKTTLIQGILRGLGVAGPIPSPTFTILEPYVTNVGYELLHLDLYRINQPHELLNVGIEDYATSGAAWFIEWPSRGTDIIPPADVEISLMHGSNSRIVTIQSQRTEWLT